MRKPPSNSLAEADFSVSFENVAGGVLATYVVTFPTASGLRRQGASLRHVDQHAAEAWVHDQATRRGISRITRP